MSRPLWKGQLSFGLVSLPVVLQSAESRFDLHFTLLDSRNRSRVRYERVNEETGAEVPWNQIVKGYEYHKGNYVVLSESDFKKAAVEATNTVEIEDFVGLDKISPLYFDKPYYLVPGKGGEKGYVLLREALKRAGRVGIAKVVIRTRQYLAAVAPQGAALVLMVLRFHQELRDFTEVAAAELPKLKAQRIAPKELELAGRLIDAMSSDWSPARYHDEYRDALMKWIEKKAKAGGKALPEPEEERHEAAPGTHDVMELLRRSVEGAHPARPRLALPAPPSKGKPKTGARKKAQKRRGAK